MQQKHKASLGSENYVKRRGQNTEIQFMHNLWKFLKNSELRYRRVSRLISTPSTTHPLEINLSSIKIFS
jgi:hypothetical protein